MGGFSPSLGDFTFCFVKIYVKSLERLVVRDMVGGTSTASDTSQLD